METISLHRQTPSTFGGIAIRLCAAGALMAAFGQAGTAVAAVAHLSPYVGELLKTFGLDHKIEYGAESFAKALEHLSTHVLHHDIVHMTAARRAGLNHHLIKLTLHALSSSANEAAANAPDARIKDLLEVVASKSASAAGGRGLSAYSRILEEEPNPETLNQDIVKAVLDPSTVEANLYSKIEKLIARALGGETPTHDERKIVIELVLVSMKLRLSEIANEILVEDEQTRAKFHFLVTQIHTAKLDGIADDQKEILVRFTGVSRELEIVSNLVSRGQKEQKAILSQVKTEVERVGEKVDKVGNKVDRVHGDVIHGNQRIEHLIRLIELHLKQSGGLKA